MSDFINRITLDSGAMLQGILAFCVSFFLFGWMMSRAWTMGKDKFDHVATLPLEEDTESHQS